MAKHSRKPASPSATTKLLLAALLLFTAHLASAEPLTLRPYEAVYTISKSGISADLRRKLASNKDGSWTLSDHSSILFFEMSEETRVDVSGSDIKPLIYRYRQNPGKRKNQTIRYDWEKNIAICQLAKRTERTQIEAPSFDKLSYQMQLRLDLLHDNFGDNKTYVLVDRGRLKHYQLERVGEETIATGRGLIHTVKLRQTTPGKDRESMIWVAPKLDYLVVQIRHRDKGEEYELQLKSATLLGPSQR